MVTFQTKLLICRAKKEVGRRDRVRQNEKRGRRTERDDGSDCTMPHTLEAQSPWETAARLVRGMTVQQ